MKMIQYDNRCSKSGTHFVYYDDGSCKCTRASAAAVAAAGTPAGAPKVYKIPAQESRIESDQTNYHFAAHLANSGGPKQGEGIV